MTSSDQQAKAMEDEQVNELGLLSYNYDVTDVSGSIDDSGTNDSNSSKKKRKLSNPFKKPADVVEMNLIPGPAQNANANPGVQDGRVSTDSQLNQCQLYCRGLFYWIPIRQLCLLGSLLFLILPFFGNYKGKSLGVYFMSWYIQLFGILGLFIESPTWWLTKKVQLAVFFYARFLRRTSGRALFYFSVSLCTFASVHDAGVNATMFAGIFMVAVALLMLMFSFLAAKQLHEMYSYMRHNGQMDGDKVDHGIDNFNEDVEEHLKERLTNYYAQIDHERSNKIGSKQLHSFAEQALKRKLSNSENYTIRLYLDASCNGHVTAEDWAKQFMRSGKVKLL